MYLGIPADTESIGAIGGGRKEGFVKTANAGGAIPEVLLGTLVLGARCRRVCIFGPPWMLPLSGLMAWRKRGENRCAMCTIPHGAGRAHITYHYCPTQICEMSTSLRSRTQPSLQRKAVMQQATAPVVSADRRTNLSACRSFAMAGDNPLQGSIEEGPLQSTS